MREASREEKREFEIYFFNRTYILKRLENLCLLYLLIGLSNSF